MARHGTHYRGASEAGTVALEYGLLLPAMIAVFFGSMDVSRLIWTYTALNRAITAAARCAAVNKTACATTTQVQALAVSQSWGLTVSQSAFTVNLSTANAEVTVNYDFAVTVPFLGETLTPGNHRITLTARYPMLQ